MISRFALLGLVACASPGSQPGGTCTGKCDGAGSGDSPSQSVPTLYANWKFLASSGHVDIASEVRVDLDPGDDVTMFFGAQYGIDASGGGGYIGIQDGAERSTGATGRIALFSIWNASSATPGDAGSWCVHYGNEGSGESCHIDFDWSEGDTYRMSVAQIAAGTWRGSVVDEQTGAVTVLGDITVPASWGLLDDYLTNFTEDYAQNSGLRYDTCDDAPMVSATFFAPTADLDATDASSVVADTASDATCTNVVSAADVIAGYATQTIE